MNVGSRFYRLHDRARLALLQSAPDSGSFNEDQIAQRILRMIRDTDQHRTVRFLRCPFVRRRVLEIRGCVHESAQRAGAASRSRRNPAAPRSPLSRLSLTVTSALAGMPARGSLA